MDLSSGINIYILLAFGIFSCVFSSQLYLQPIKSDHAYFTGDNFFVTCFTTDDSIDKLKWTDFDNQPIGTEEGRIHAQPAEGDQMGLRLVFTNVETEDAGTYTCSDEQDSVNFDLTVYRAVSFSDTQSVQHAPEGETGTVLCNVKSDPKPVVNWYFKGTKISNKKENKKYHISPENHSLRINNLTRNDAGDYKCKAFVITPLSSQVKDFDIKLHVQYIPEIIGQHKLITYASVGSKKNLTCTVTADPVPLFQWLRDEMIIHNNTKNFIIYNTDNTSNLQMTVDDETRFGEYICRASNPLGEKEVIIELREGQTPSVPELSVVGEDQGAVKLSLKAKYDLPRQGDDLKVTGFKVEYIFASETWDSLVAEEFKIGEIYELRNMSFNSDYMLRAAALNAAGYGNYTDEIPYKTHSLQTASVIAGASNSAAPVLALMGSLLLYALLLL